MGRKVGEGFLFFVPLTSNTEAKLLVHSIGFGLIWMYIEEIVVEGEAPSPVAVVRRLVDGRLLDHFVRVDGHGSPHALVRALQAVVVGSEYVHLAGHPRRREVGQVLAALFLLVDLALMAIVAAIPRLRTATETRTKGKKQT